MLTKKSCGSFKIVPPHYHKAKEDPTELNSFGHPCYLVERSSACRLGITVQFPGWELYFWMQWKQSSAIVLVRTSAIDCRGTDMQWSRSISLKSYGPLKKKKNCDCGIYRYAVAEQHYLKKLRYAAAEVLPSSLRSYERRHKKICACQPQTTTCNLMYFKIQLWYGKVDKTRRGSRDRPEAVETIWRGQPPSDGSHLLGSSPWNCFLIVDLINQANRM